MRLALLFAISVPAYAAGLTATPSVLDWTYVSGSHNYPADRVALVSSTGATAYSATATSENGWLLVNAAYVSSSATLSLGAYLTTASPIDVLGNGVYQGTVNLTDAGGNTATVTVNLTVTGVVRPASCDYAQSFGTELHQRIQRSGADAECAGHRTNRGDAAGAGGFGRLPGLAAGGGDGRCGEVHGGGDGDAGEPQPGNLPGNAGVFHRDRGRQPSGIADHTGGVQPDGIAVGADVRLHDRWCSAQPVGINVGTTTGAGIAFSASSIVQSGNWLVVSAGVTAPGTITVRPEVAGLTPGFYSGSVLITPQGGNPLTIPVSLTVRAAPVISVSAGSLSFSYRRGDAVPAPLNVQVAGGGPFATFSVQVVSGASWLLATPAVGTAPATLKIAVQPASLGTSLAAGTYNGTIVVTGTGTAQGSATITVTLEVLAEGMSIARVVNAAGYQEGGIAPGELVTIFGSGLAPADTVTLVLDASGKVATALHGVQVLFNGTPAPMIYTTQNQLAAVAPYELDGLSSTTVQVLWNGQASNTVQLPVTGAAPGIFTADASGTGPAAALTDPTGTVITLYLTGEGQTAPPGRTGSVTEVSATPPLTPAPVLPVSVMLGGQPANFQFKGEAPGIVAGVLQLNVEVPQGMAAGSYPVVVTIGGKATQAGVTVTVQ